MLSLIVDRDEMTVRCASRTVASCITQLSWNLCSQNQSLVSRCERHTKRGTQINYLVLERVAGAHEWKMV